MEENIDEKRNLLYKTFPTKKCFLILLKLMHCNLLATCKCIRWTKDKQIMDRSSS